MRWLLTTPLLRCMRSSVDPSRSLRIRGRRLFCRRRPCPTFAAAFAATAAFGLAAAAAAAAAAGLAAAAAGLAAAAAISAPSAAAFAGGALGVQVRVGFRVRARVSDLS